MAKQIEHAVNTDALVRYTVELFDFFKQTRTQNIEMEWEEDIDQYKGRYNKRWLAKEGLNKRSKFFFKLTTVKTDTLQSKIMETGFAGSSIPFSVTPVGYENMMMGGQPVTKEQAEAFAAQRKKRIEGILERGRFHNALNSATHDQCQLGNGAILGPFKAIERCPDGQGGFKKEEYLSFEYVPITEVHTDWTFMNPDPNKGPGFMWLREVHKSDFSAWAFSPGYIPEGIREAIRKADDFKGQMESSIEEMKRIVLGDTYTGGVKAIENHRIPVLACWIPVPVRLLREAGLEIPMIDGVEPEDDDLIEAEIEIASSDVLIKAEVNRSGKRKLLMFQYKNSPKERKSPGVPRSMSDSQNWINSIIRLIMDVKAITGYPMLQGRHDSIDWKRTKGGDRVGPAKIWWIKPGQNQLPLEAINWQDNTASLVELKSMAEAMADEETGTPKYTSGNDATYLNKTARGMAMLMRQQELVLKPTFRSIDNQLLEPIIEAISYYLDETEKPMIPLKYRATGVESIMAKEIKLENLESLQRLVASYPQLAMFVENTKLLRRMATLIDSEDLIVTPEKEAAIMKAMEESAGAEPKLIERLDIKFSDLMPDEQGNVLKERGIPPSPTRQMATEMAVQRGQAALSAPQPEPAEVANAGQVL